MDLKNMVSRLRLRHIELLNALASEANLARCAERLNMSQPTSSKALREIEDIFGVPLFIRNRRGMVPTAMGSVLTRRASMLLEEMRAMHQEYESTKHGSTGRIRIGLFPVAIPALFPKWRKQLLEKSPNLVVSANEGLEFTLLEALSKGQLDCILGRVVIDRLTADLRYELLYKEPTVIVCGVKHPAGKARKNAVFKTITESNWILPSSEGASFNLVASRLAEEGLAAPRVAFEATSVYLTLQMLNEENMLSLLPLGVAQAFSAMGSLRIVPIELPSSRVSVGIIYRSDAASSPLIKEALSAARTVTTGLDNSRHA